MVLFGWYILVFSKRLWRVLKYFVYEFTVEGGMILEGYFSRLCNRWGCSIFVFCRVFTVFILGFEFCFVKEKGGYRAMFVVLSRMFWLRVSLGFGRITLLGRRCDFSRWFFCIRVLGGVFVFFVLWKDCVFVEGIIGFVGGLFCGGCLFLVIFLVFWIGI